MTPDTGSRVLISSLVCCTHDQTDGDLTATALGGESWGAELEAMGQFGGFQANGGLGCLDAEFSNSACISDTSSPGTDTGRD